jgi:hypothetical protein
MFTFRFCTSDDTLAFSMLTLDQPLQYSDKATFRLRFITNYVQKNQKLVTTVHNTNINFLDIIHRPVFI